MVIMFLNGVMTVEMWHVINAALYVNNPLMFAVLYILVS